MLINITYIACFKPVGKPQKRYKYCVKETINRAGIDPKTWEKKTKDRVPCRYELKDAVKSFRREGVII